MEIPGNPESPESCLEWLTSHGITHEVSQCYIQHPYHHSSSYDNPQHALQYSTGFLVSDMDFTPFLEMSRTRNLWNTSWNICAESSLVSGMQHHLLDRFQAGSGPFSPWNHFLLHRLDLQPAPDNI